MIKFIIIHNFHRMILESKKGKGGGSELCLPVGGTYSGFEF